MAAYETVGNTLEKGISGDYQLHMRAIFKEAWQRVKGFKAKFWGAFLLLILISLLTGFVRGLFEGMTKAVYSLEGTHHLAIFIGFLAFSIMIMTLIVNLALGAGITLLGIRNVSSQEIRVTTLFVAFRSVKVLLRIFGAHLLLLFLFMIVPIPFIVAGIWVHHYFVHTAQESLSILETACYILALLSFMFLALAYSFTFPLLVERKLGVWRAAKTSIVAISRHWFKFFFISLLNWLITIVLGVITLGIGLIWTMPWSVNVYSIMYRDILGVEIKSLAEA